MNEVRVITLKTAQFYPVGGQFCAFILLDIFLPLSCPEFRLKPQVVIGWCTKSLEKRECYCCNRTFNLEEGVGWWHFLLGCTEFDNLTLYSSLAHPFCSQACCSRQRSLGNRSIGLVHTGQRRLEGSVMVGRKGEVCVFIYTIHGTSLGVLSILVLFVTGSSRVCHAKLQRCPFIKNPL